MFRSFASTSRPDPRQMARGFKEKHPGRYAHYFFGAAADATDSSFATLLLGIPGGRRAIATTADANHNLIPSHTVQS